MTIYIRNFVLDNYGDNFTNFTNKCKDKLKQYEEEEDLLHSKINQTIKNKIKKF